MRTLYKYMEANRAQICLPAVGDGTLRATQPAALNDPFECFVNERFVEPVQPDEIGWLCRALTEINVNSPVTEEQVHYARDKYGSLYYKQLLAQQLSTRFGIVSFATDPLNTLMWSHYAQYGSGFVVGYDSVRIGDLSTVRGSLREVEYRRAPIAMRGPSVVQGRLANEYTILSTKSDHWSYEKEWRLIVQLNETIGQGALDPFSQPINVVRVPNEAVVSVFFTERTPAKVVDMIRDRLTTPNNRYQNVELQKLVMSTTAYGYEIAGDDADQQSTDGLNL